jgi:hypothetical protein
VPPPEYSPRREQQRAHLRYVAAHGTPEQRREALDRIEGLDWEDEKARAFFPPLSDRRYSLQRTCLALGEVCYGVTS